MRKRKGAVTCKRTGLLVRWTWWREINDGRGWMAPMESGRALTRRGGARRARRDARKHGWRNDQLPLVDQVRTFG